MTLPDCVVLMTIGFRAGGLAAGAWTVATIAVGFGASGSMTVAPGGAV
jgi:hypothetical protein